MRAGGLPCDQMVGHHPSHGGNHRLGHGDIQKCATLRIIQCRRDRKGCSHAAHGICQRVAHAQRRAIAITGDRHYAADPLHDLVIGGVVLPRTVLPKAADGAIDEVWIFRPKHLIPDAKAVHHAGAEVLNQYVRCANKALEKRLASFVFHVEGHGFLLRVLRQKTDPHQGFIPLRVGPQLAGQITGAGALDLDDFCTQQGQLITAIRPRKHIGQVKNPNPGERFNPHRPPRQHGRGHGARGSSEQSPAEWPAPTVPASSDDQG